MRLYLILSWLSRFIRQDVMPNPFEIFDGNVWIELLGLGVLPGIVAFKTVGLFYENGSFPAIGVIAFFAIYFLYHQLISWFGSIGAPLILVIGALIGLYLLLSSIKNDLYF